MVIELNLKKAFLVLQYFSFFLNCGLFRVLFALELQLILRLILGQCSPYKIELGHFYFTRVKFTSVTKKNPPAESLFYIITSLCTECSI